MNVCYTVHYMEQHDYILSAEQKAELKRLGVVLCYLHGSMAMGLERGDSDLDVAVLLDSGPKDAVDVTTSIIAALASFVPSREIDVAILNDASPLLAQSVAVRGKLLYARSSEDDLLFQIRAMHEYESSRRIVHIGQYVAATRAPI